MNEITKAAILLNASYATQKIFSNLCRGHEPCELWKSESLWNEIGLTPAMKQKLSRLLYDDWAKRELERTENFNARFITSYDLDYPARLLELRKPPIGLYVKGSVNLTLPSIAIVGTRKCSAYAEGVAFNLGKALAQAGITTISGGASGIDTAGHRGVLSVNGVTVVVFGTGLDKCYPAANRDLFARILERGAWVSEYPFGTGGKGWRFTDRDRLIAAISSTVVIAESPEGGGAMHTARIGIETGREVWSIPGRITDEVSRGTNMLMNEGSKTLFDINSFINIIKGEHVQVDINFDVEDAEAPELTDSEKIIYSLLRHNGGRTTDELMIESSLDIWEVQTALTCLEAEGLIANSFGRYSVC